MLTKCVHLKNCWNPTLNATVISPMSVLFFVFLDKYMSARSEQSLICNMDLV